MRISAWSSDVCSSDLEKHACRESDDPEDRRADREGGAERVRAHRFERPLIVWQLNRKPGADDAADQREQGNSQPIAPFARRPLPPGGAVVAGIERRLPRKRPVRRADPATRAAACRPEW